MFRDEAVDVAPTWAQNDETDQGDYREIDKRLRSIAKKKVDPGAFATVTAIRVASDCRSRPRGHGCESDRLICNGRCNRTRRNDRRHDCGSHLAWPEIAARAHVGADVELDGGLRSRSTC
jgi:hypothetical protein